MANPTPKAVGVEALLTALTGQHRPTTIRSNTCVWCKADAQEFRDELSRREYRISGLCQVCQDEVFGTDEDEFIPVELDINANVID